MNPEALRRRADKPSAGVFATTHWSIVLQAGGADSPASRTAMAELCEAYWYPLYAHLRRLNHAPDDAQDLVQGFFERLLRSSSLGQVAPERGRFRSWLLASLRHHLADARDRDRALKRGGGVPPLALDVEGAESLLRLEPTGTLGPEEAFDRRWALTVLRQGLEDLRHEYLAAGKADLFDALRHTLPGGSGTLDYATIAADLGLTEGAVKVAVHRLRQRYRTVLRDRVARTLENPDRVDEELAHLVAALGGGPAAV
ncbi:MAG: sigma-70 family RNA polymerase sigma factor [Verrucomicrobiales bacterium]|nr:sigma-70 family RNA polymerase sigma factor [Verrucomicrobiales bacterium]